MQNKIVKMKNNIMPKSLGKSRRGNDLYESNPFLVDFAVEITEKKLTIAKGHKILNKEGEHIADAGIHQIIQVDNEEFVKIYTTNVAVLFELKKTATRMLGLLLRCIQENAIGKDQVVFTYTIANKLNIEITEKRLPKTSYIDGIDELIKRNFIAESPNGVGIYYINPNLIFNGDRVKFITEYQKTPVYKETEKKYLSKTEQLELDLENTDIGDDEI